MNEATYVTYKQLIISLVAISAVIVALMGGFWSLHEREHNYEHDRLERIERKLDFILVRSDVDITRPSN
jgi:hypothetical protein